MKSEFAQLEFYSGIREPDEDNYLVFLESGVVVRIITCF